MEGLDSFPSLETEFAKLPMLLEMLGATLLRLVEVELLIEIAVKLSCKVTFSAIMNLSN